MKNSIIVILISAFAFFAVSCGKMKEQESKKEEKKTEVRKDSVRKEQNTSAAEPKKYSEPSDKIVYVDVLPEEKADIPVSSLKEWKENDVKEYLDLSYTGSGKGGADSEELFLKKGDDGNLSAEYVTDNGHIKMSGVKIEGNKFYSVLSYNGITEEFNGKFMKFKAPVKGDSDYIYGLLINRKGNWKFFYMYF